jgi:hypothetical protein
MSQKERPPFIDLKDSGDLTFIGTRFTGDRPSVKAERVQGLRMWGSVHETGVDDRSWFHRHPWWSTSFIGVAAGIAVALLTHF